MQGKAPSITTDPTTVQNESILIDLVIRIKLTRAILMPLFSNFLKNSTIHFHVFLDLVACFLRVTVSLLCWSQAVQRYMFQLFPI